MTVEARDPKGPGEELAISKYPQSIDAQQY
jgi:hypothetical protein